MSRIYVPETMTKKCRDCSEEISGDRSIVQKTIRCKKCDKNKRRERAEEWIEENREKYNETHRPISRKWKEKKKIEKYMEKVSKNMFWRLEYDPVINGSDLTATYEWHTLNNLVNNSRMFAIGTTFTNGKDIAIVNSYRRLELVTKKPE